jgi:CheY-like chemotaxis protein
MQTKAKVPGRILVVDDEISVRQLLERVLARAGHQVEVAEAGEDALAKLAKEKYDLLIIDKNLPGLFSYIVKPFGIVDIVRACDEAINAGRASVGET